MFILLMDFCSFGRLFHNLDILSKNVRQSSILWGAKVAVIMCNIVRHWQFSKKSSMGRWEKLGDIERH
jgi:hypothetical protein